MAKPFIESLKMLSSHSITKVENTDGTTVIYFSNNDKISGTYWRLIGLPKERLSSFDDGQKYGLREKINATKNLAEAVVGKGVSVVKFDSTSGDLEIELSDNFKIQVFNFSGNEVWEVEFHDGSGQLSNFV